MLKPNYFIDDIETEQDELGDAHKYVAEAIYQQIKDMDGGKAIALEGGWGSGKSSVVKKVKSKIQIEDEIEMIIFDVWGHQGDPLRRSFLEHLINFFLEKEMIDCKKWKERIEFLSQVKEEKREVKTPSTTWAGGLLILSGLLIPLGTFTFVNEKISDVVGSIILSLPLFVAFFSALYITCIKWQKNRKKKIEEKNGNNLLENLVLIKESSTKTETSTSKTPNPTSIEFLDTFKELMIDVFIDKNKLKKIVIVIDNLDRVSAENALDLWSTMRIFLEECRRENVWARKIWVVVPYDFASISKLWKDGDKNETASSFINKSFQLRYEVPPAVLTNWKKFFIDKLTEAFQDEINEKSKEMLFKVFNFVYEEEAGKNIDKKGSSPTPREIKLCINDLGTLYRVVSVKKLKIPIEHQFAYVMITRTHQGKDIPTLILNKAIPSPSLLTLLSEELTLSLAALWYKQPQEIAQQLLLGEPLRIALKNRNSEFLKEWLNEDGTKEVLDLIIKESDAFLNISELTNATLCLYDNSLISPTEKDGEINYIINNLRLNLNIKLSENYVYLNKDIGKGLNLLIGNDLTYTNKVISYLCRADIFQSMHRSYQNWANCFIESLREKDNLFHNNTFDINFRPIDEDHLINVMSEFGDSPKLLPFIDIIDLETKRVQSRLTSRISSTTLDENFLRAITNLNQTKYILDYAETISEILNTIDLKEGTPEFFECLFQLIWELSKMNKIYENKFKSSADLGLFLDYCYNNNSINNEVSAITTHLFLHGTLTSSSYLSSAQPGLAYIESKLNTPDNNVEFSDKLINKLERKDLLGKIWCSTDLEPLSWPFYVYVLKRKLNEEILFQLIDFERLMKNWEKIKEKLDENEFIRLIKTLDDKQGLTVVIPNTLFDIKEHAEKFLFLLEHLKKNKDGLSNSILFFINGLNDYELSGIIQYETNSRLLYTIKDKLNKAKIRNAIEQIAQHCYNRKPIEINEELKKLIAFFIDDIHFINRIVNIFKTIVKSHYSQHMYELFGDYILNDSLTEYKNINLELELFDIITERSTEIELNWLLKFVKHNQIQNISEQTKQKIKDKLNSDTDQSAKDKLSQLLDYFEK